MWKWRKKNGAARPNFHGGGFTTWLEGICTIYEARPRLLAELRRARRHERPLTLLTLAPERVLRLPGADENSRGAFGVRGAVTPRSWDANGARPLPDSLPLPVPPHSELLFVGALLRNTMRESDLLALSPEDPGYAVLLPEAGEPEGQAAAYRFDGVIRERAGLAVRVGAARFPQDGFTIEDLLGSSRHAFRNRPLILPAGVAELPERHRE